jgi:hypothetical protein
MKKIVFSLSLLLIVLSTQFCGTRRFVAPTFYEKANNHRVIAVLPFEMIFTGKQPKKLTGQQIKKIEEMESLAFQDSLYHLLFRQSTKRHHPVRIEIQPVVRTNRTLDNHGIGIRESWDIESEELARILQVDAVVRTRVEKRRYMSGLASFGIELGSAILNEILNDEIPIWLFVRAPTNAIRAECYLYNRRDGSALWGISLVDDTDWRLPANEIIHHINHYFARKFPYR